MTSKRKNKRQVSENDISDLLNTEDTAPLSPERDTELGNEEAPLSNEGRLH
jgi:hypothetical protein